MPKVQSPINKNNRRKGKDKGPSKRNTVKIKEDDVVLCTVKKIEGTTVFLEIEGNGQGSIIMSEVAAGRIRNLRNYVAPNRKVVCKVLKVGANNVELSLRRVTAKERVLVMDQYKKERNFISILKTSVKNSETILKKIKSSYNLADFLEEARNNPKLLEKFMTKTEAQKLSKLLEEKREKERKIKKVITLKSSSSSGLADIQEILNLPDSDIHYLGSSRFSISASSTDFKQAQQKIDLALEQIEKRAKQKHALLEIEK